MRLFLAVFGLVMLSAGVYACDACGCQDKKEAKTEKEAPKTCAVSGKGCKVESKGCAGKGCGLGRGMAKLNLTEEQKEKMQAIKAECRAKMMAVLTPEQAKKMEAMKGPKKGCCGGAKKGCGTK